MAARNLSDCAIVLHPTDNVAVLKCPLKPGDELLDGSVSLAISEPIGAGHKVAIEDISQGRDVRKYGQSIGIAAVSSLQGSMCTRTTSLSKDARVALIFVLMSARWNSFLRRTCASSPVTSAPMAGSAREITSPSSPV
jgi:hypothetical protein